MGSFSIFKAGGTDVSDYSRAVVDLSSPLISYAEERAQAEAAFSKNRLPWKDGFSSYHSSIIGPIGSNADSKVPCFETDRQILYVIVAMLVSPSSALAARGTWTVGYGCDPFLQQSFYLLISFISIC